jgi:transposase
MPTQVPRPETERLKTHYVCSDCWGHLVLFPDPQTHLIDVRCMTEGCPCSGYVTRGFTARREQEQVLERMEVRAALQGLVDWIEPRRSVAQNLAELGFG